MISEDLVKTLKASGNLQSGILVNADISCDEVCSLGKVSRRVCKYFILLNNILLLDSNPGLFVLWKI